MIISRIIVKIHNLRIYFWQMYATYINCQEFQLRVPYWLTRHIYIYIYICFCQATNVYMVMVEAKKKSNINKVL